MKSFRLITLKVIAIVLVLCGDVAFDHGGGMLAAPPSKTTQQKKSGGTRRGAKSPRTSAEARKMQEETQRDIKQTKEKIRLNEREIKEGLADLNHLSSEIKAGRAKVADLNKKVVALQGEISALNEHIAKNENELRQLRDEYLKAIKNMRLTRKNQSMLAFIFASDDFNQAMRRWRYLRQFSKWKERKSDEIHGLIETLGNEREMLSKAEEAHSVSLGQLSATQRELESKHQKQAKLIEGLKQNGAALQTHLSQKQNEANQLKNAISALIAQEQAKAEAERKAKAEAERVAREKAEAERIAKAKAEAERKAAELAKSQQDNDNKKSVKKKKDKKKDKNEKDRTSRNKDRGRKDKNSAGKQAEASGSKEVSRQKDTKPAASSNFAALRGNLPCPVDGSWRITNPFGRHSMPELPEVVYDNPGIDAEVAKGATVKAVAAGTVSGVYKLSGYGTVVIVNHGEYYSVYGNLASVNVSVGTSLSAGSAVGNAAADPDDQRRGSVHFEIWRGREKQNPESWLR